MSAFTRMLNRHGEDWTLSGWANLDRDEYEDELPTEPTEIAFKAFRQSVVDEEDVDEKGVNKTERLDLLVDLSLALPSQTLPDQPVTLTSSEGRTYNLIGVDKTSQPVGAKKLKLSTGAADANVYF